MRTRTWIRFVLLASLPVFLGCKDDDKEITPTPKEPENPITTFLEESDDLAEGTRTSGPWELGVLFTASVPGKITQVGSKMPEPGSYRVIIWDYDTEEILRQKTVEQTAPGILKLYDIEPLLIEDNKKYIISINTRDSGVNKPYYYAVKTGGGDFVPFTRGSILVHEACYTSTSAAEMPAAVTDVTYELYGFPEFTFIPD
ncbi:MAG: DUF4082 domain-containing protein [Bacteroidota bacterium]|jgi:hypothetical protein|nr:MAG: hypothetical protein DIU61_04645 [Bacteroidota bacterium]